CGDRPAADLAMHTGLRQGDLLRLRWSDIGEDRIEILTSKSRHRTRAIIPLYDDLRTVLSSIPKRSPIVLTNSNGRPWRERSFQSVFSKTKTGAGVRRELHFHDLRGTAATRFYLANIPVRVIAEMLGWEEESVGQIIRRYVHGTAATAEVI